MSSSTSDSSLNVPQLNTITSYISYIQQKNILTKERFRTIRRYFFQSIGLYVLLYYLFRLLITFYFLLKSILNLTFQMLSIGVFLPFKFIDLFLPKTTSYNILFPSIWFCSILSFFIAKLSHKNIEIHFANRFKSIKRYSFTATFVILLLLQSVLILLPLTQSIQEQRKLSLNSTPIKQPGINLAEKKLVEANTEANTPRKNFEPLKRELHDHQREELSSINNDVKTNQSSRSSNEKELFDSRGTNSELESNVEDGYSYSKDFVNQDKNTADQLTIQSRDKLSLGKERSILLQEQANYFVDSDEEFSSKVLEKLSQINQANIEQIEEILSDKTKEEKTKLSVNFKSEQQRTEIWREKINNWLSEAWNIWYQTKLDFQHIFPLRAKHTHILSRHDVSSSYLAYTDLNCYDYTQPIYHSRLSKQKHVDFLNTYRYSSPFPIYISILKSNGPQCYRDYPNSLCAINSNSFFLTSNMKLYRKLQFLIMFSTPIIIFIVIIKIITYRTQQRKCTPSFNVNPPTVVNTTKYSSSQKTTSNKLNTMRPLDVKLERELRSWLEHEQNDGYQKLSEACRIALNNTFSKNKEQLNIETLQFANANIHDISQTAFETIAINASLDIVHLIFNIINPIKYQHYSIEIPKLTGELQISVTSSTNQYSIEVKFKQIQIDNADIIDPKNVLSSDEKQEIIKLLKETIKQTIVQCCCHLFDSQENNIHESKTQRSITPLRPEPSNTNPQCETPVLSLNSNNNQPISPENEVKKLVVRIVKAVKLYDVEQPFCIVELNQPKQTHQTSIAKNGVNPFWDECFVFDSNNKSNQIRLKIIDRKKPNKKHSTPIIDTVYADVAIPFSYVTSQSYKQDVRITPQHPDSIIRIEFASLPGEETLPEASKIQPTYQRSPSDEIVSLPYNGNISSKDNTYANNAHNFVPIISRQRTNDSAIDTLSATSTLISYNDDKKRNKPRKAHSFMSSFRRTIFHRRKKNNNDEQNDYDGASSLNSTIHSDAMPHSLSAEPCVSLSPASPPNFHRGHSITRSFRNMFRSKGNKKTLDTSNVTIDHHDSVSTSTPTPKKRSFFHPFKSEKKRRTNGSANSLTSDDCTRSASARNTPVRANVGRPVTMTKTLVR
ncbi:unnamed protein product [Rotaria socialis]|uniref:C2 domain-containing protein n=1 Tax=Rotaria socialis TaxID=392032 RepID=A0A817UND3_9BILA|nr:unnamed protein product [Rotaria socialis]